MGRFTTAVLAVTMSLMFAFGQQGYAASPPAISLHMAVLQGNLHAVQKHIEAGSELNEKDAYGSTPLIIAITFDKTGVAKALIEAGADVTLGNNEGSTPLHLAAFFGRIKIVKALLDKGADRYLRDPNGSTPFDIVAAPFEDDKAIYDTLKQALAPLGLQLDYEQIEANRPTIAEMLRPTPDELREVGYTPLSESDWMMSTPEEQGLDPALVAELYLDAAHLETLYSLLVVKNGKLVAEGYFNKGSVDQLSKRASVTKSYVSAIMGIALAHGCLASVDQKMIDFFPTVATHIKDARKKEITVRQLLQMRGGYPWEETDPAYWDALWSGTYLDDIVNLPLTADPGTMFQYSNLTSNWLGIIVARACKTDLKTFGQEHLFSRLGTRIDAIWNKDRDGYYIGSGDIQVTSRDMAKFGLLYLNDGAVNGQQIVPAKWVHESLQRYSEEAWTTPKIGRYFGDIGYGYQWWSASVAGHHFNFAWGHGGQLIVLLGEFNMVIVTTADPFYGKDTHFESWPYEKAIINLVGKFINSLPKT